MSRLEDELKRALRPQPPAEGFSDHVLAQLGKKYVSRASTHFGWRQFFARLFARPVLRFATAAALSAALVAGGAHYHQVQLEKARQGEAAKQQLMLALRIASSKLQLAKAKVNEVSDGNEIRHEKE